VADGLTRLLEDADRGDAASAARILPVVYYELRRLAAENLAAPARRSRIQQSLAIPSTRG
jgi:ECF sigma factor